MIPRRRAAGTLAPRKNTYQGLEALDARDGIGELLDLVVGDVLEGAHERSRRSCGKGAPGGPVSVRGTASTTSEHSGSCQLTSTSAASARGNRLQAGNDRLQTRQQRLSHFADKGLTLRVRARALGVTAFLLAFQKQPLVQPDALFGPAKVSCTVAARLLCVRERCRRGWRWACPWWHW
jgi:hypothetical protein